jgi:hypothetical protein
MLLDFILHGDIYFIIEISPGHEKKKKKRGHCGTIRGQKQKLFYFPPIFIILKNVEHNHSKDRGNSTYCLETIFLLLLLLLIMLG